MSLLSTGYFQDGLKALVYLVPLAYLVVKRKSLNLKFFWLFFIGLGLLFFGHLVDFMDEIEFLRERFPSEGMHYLQDFLEDMVGFTLGFGIFVLALYLELKRKRRR